MNKKNNNVKKWHNITEEEFRNKRILTPEKCDILFHNAFRKILIGGKGSGKSIISMCDALFNFENNRYFSAMGLRLYKGQASDKLSKLFQNAVSIFNLKGIKTFDYTRVYNRIYQKIYKSSNDKNNIFEWGSLEASSSTDGTAGVNGGILGMAVLDEPIVKGSNAPTTEEWNETMSIIKDNLKRTIDQHNSLRKDDEDFQKAKYTEYLSCNPWGDHPILDEAEIISPEIEFEKFILGYELNDLLKDNDLVNDNWGDISTRLLLNHTLTIYDSKSKVLVSRMTKFANPLNRTKEAVDELLYKIKWNLLKGSRQSFCILLGLKHEEVEEKSMLVYDIKDFRLTDIHKFINNGWKPQRFTYSLDIDTSREFTITSGVFLRKAIRQFDNDEPWKYIYHFHVLPTIIINAYGTGQAGELNDFYVDEIKKRIEKHYNNYLTRYNLPLGDLWVDDNRMHYANDLKKLGIACIGQYKMFLKAGKWDILSRQDIMQTLFKGGKISLDRSNVELVKDIKFCVKDDLNSAKRKTSSTTNHLDIIDSVEQLFWNYVGWLQEYQNKYKLLDEIGGSYD